jgi:excisionase family DNA binding protein
MAKVQVDPQSAQPSLTFFTMDEAAEILKVSRSTLIRMKRAGEIAFVTVGTGTKRPRVRFTPQNLDEWRMRAEVLANRLPSARRAIREA